MEAQLSPHLAAQVPTSVDPETAARAEELLAHFGRWTEYKHGADNDLIPQLEAVDELPLERAVHFLNAWWGFSYCTPRVLLRCAAAFPDVEDRAAIMQNYIEEDGLARPGDDTHHVLLQKLVQSMGGEVYHVEWSEEMVRTAFFDRTEGMTPAFAAGVLSAFEHPALDITRLIELVVLKAGFADLFETDPYLVVHRVVEPSHIVWAHSSSLKYCELGFEDEVKAGFQMVMDFWISFWARVVDEVLGNVELVEGPRVGRSARGRGRVIDVVPLS